MNLLFILLQSSKMTEGAKRMAEADLTAGLSRSYL